MQSSAAGNSDREHYDKSLTLTFGLEAQVLGLGVDLGVSP